MGFLIWAIFICPVFSQDLSWTPIGPEGGFLISFAIAPSDPHILYGGCDIYGGVYKSTNRGENWEFMGMVSELGSIQDIQIHPDSSNMVYAAGEDGSLYKTIDGGLNWKPILKRNAVAYSIGIDPHSPNVVYAGFRIHTADQYGFYKSMDNGMTWSDSSFQANNVLDIVFDPDSVNTLYVGTSYGVHRSRDGGKTWDFLGPPDPSATIFSLVVVDFNTIYAGSHEDERDKGKVYKTINGGETWDISSDLGTTVYGLDVDPQNTDVFYMAACSNKATFGKEGVYKTTDGGDTWFPVNNGLADRMARGVKVDPGSPNIVYAIADGLGGVYKSTDGAESWEQITSGMQQTIIQSMCFDLSHTLFGAVGWGTYRDVPCIFRSEDNGLSWDTLTTIPSPYYMTSIWDVLADPDTADLIYVGGLSHYSDTVEDPTRGLLYRSHDGGTNWETLWTPEDKWILCLAIDPVTKNLYAGTGGSNPNQVYQIFKSTDGGDIWDETSGWDYPGNPVLDIVIDPTSPSILYAGTGGAIFKSTDYGDHWTPIAALQRVHALFIDPESPNTIYAGVGGAEIDSGGVYKSTDFGVHWNPAGLQDDPITSLIGQFGASNTLYAGTGGQFLEATGNGIFRSPDNGTTWEPVNQNLSSPFILSMLVDPNAPNTIYAGTMGRGIFKTTVETHVNHILNADEKIKMVHLTNFPNPFNSNTQIEYYLPQNGRVLLSLYDISGRLIHVLVDGYQPQGFHTLFWNGTDTAGNPVASGLYFYSLQTDLSKAVHKMVLLK